MSPKPPRKRKASAKSTSKNTRVQKAKTTIKSSGCKHRPAAQGKVEATVKGERMKAKRGSAELSAYFKSYKGGLGDFHIPIFRDLKKVTSANSVLYPGCHRHITASLLFPHVVYVDNYAKVKPLFTDEKVLEFVKDNKEYPDDAAINFKCKNFESDFGEKTNSFDLLMSMSAGIVSKPCAKYLKPGGYFLASDAHYDARMAFVDPQFEFIAVYDDSSNSFDMSDAAKAGHFVTKKGDHITQAMVQESIDVPKAKRSFKLQKEALFYLFQKIKL